MRNIIQYVILYYFYSPLVPSDVVFKFDYTYRYIGNNLYWTQYYHFTMIVIIHEQFHFFNRKKYNSKF